MSIDSIDLNAEIEEKSEDDSVDSEISRSLLSLEFDKCTEHIDSYLNIHCENCNDTICCYCFVENHGGHQPIYLYKLNDKEMTELKQSKGEMELVLQQLQASQKKTKELKTCDLSNIEGDIKCYFADLHAKLHAAERNIRKELVSLKASDPDLDVVNATIRSGIWRVTQVLNFFEMMNTKQINIRALYEEVQDLKNIPCRLTTDHDTLDPIQFEFQNTFEDIEQNCMLKRAPNLEYSLLPIEDWSCKEEKQQISINKTKNNSPNYQDLQSLSKKRVSASEQNETNLRWSSNEGARTRIVLTHLNNLNSFYVQKYSVLSSLKNMNRNIERKVKRKLTSDDVKIGYIYGVKYEIKKSVSWRRGKVVDVIEKQPNTFLYSIFFIDYGNTQWVTCDRLRELDFHLVKKLPYAFECKLTNPGNVTFDVNAHLHLPKIIGEKELYLHFTKKQSDEIQEVDLLVPTSNGNVVSVRDILLKTSSAPEKEDVFLTKQLKLFKNSKKFSLDQEEQVVISYIKDPFHICIQLAHNRNVIEKMKQDIALFYECRRAISCIPVEGTDVVINYDHEFHGKWHRGRITSVDMSSQNVDVYFVDWGGSATVSWSNIKLLSEQFTKIECQAITVKLAHIQKQDINEPWPQEAVNFLKEQVLTENKFKMIVYDIDPFEVALLQIHSSANICLNSLLVGNNHAISTGNVSETLYWLNDQDTESDNDDDELSFQLIKKSEEVLIENEDFELKNGIRQQVTVLHFESPDLIYIKFMKYKTIDEDMNEELQIHYNTCRKNKDVWSPSEYCVVYDSTLNKYFRGTIKSAAGPETYIVYIYDYVRELKVPRKLIFIQDTYFKQVACHVCKCRLANIRPAGDKGNWSKLAIEILQKIFRTYKILHIKKIETNRSEKMLGVIMWYSLTTPAKALEPSKLSFISINKTLVESGVAFSITSALNTNYNANSNSVVEKDVEKLEEVIEISDDELKNGKRRRSQDWYEMICEDEQSLKDPLTSWPKGIPLQKTEFDAVLTCVDSDGCFSLRDEDIHSIYLDLEANLNSKFSSLKLTEEDVEWQPSEICTIFYENNWYRGSVLEILDAQEISVEMIDFGSEHVVKKGQLYKHIMFPDMPPLVNKLQLYDVHSKFGSWCANDVDELLKIVSDNIKVIIKSSLDCDVPSAEIYLGNGLSVNDLITQKCPHLTRYQTRVALVSVDDDDGCINNFEVTESDNTDNPLVHIKEMKLNEVNNGALDYSYAAIPQPIQCKRKMFVVNMLKWGTEYNAVLNILNNETYVNNEDFVILSDEIQKHIEEQPALDEIVINEPCVCFRPQNNLWCRAMIYNVDSLELGYILAFFVDYGTVDMVTTDNLKVMRPEWFDLPVYNRIAIINVELIHNNKAEHVLMQMNNLRGKSATVEIISEDPFKVHLYDGKNLCYQNFINCGILRAL